MTTIAEIVNFGLGSLFLLLGIVLLVLKKGTRLHVVLGRTFLIMLVLVAASSVYLLFELEDFPLNNLGAQLFIVTAAWSGYRWARRKSRYVNAPQPIDRIVPVVVLVVAIAIFADLFFQPLGGDAPYIHLLLTVAAVGIAGLDTRLFQKGIRNKAAWEVHHMTRMLLVLVVSFAGPVMNTFSWGTPSLRMGLIVLIGCVLCAWWITVQARGLGIGRPTPST